MKVLLVIACGTTLTSALPHGLGVQSLQSSGVVAEQAGNYWDNYPWWNGASEPPLGNVCGSPYGNCNNIGGMLEPSGPCYKASWLGGYCSCCAQNDCEYGCKDSQIQFYFNVGLTWTRVGQGISTVALTDGLSSIITQSRSSSQSAASTVSEAFTHKTSSTASGSVGVSFMGMSAGGSYSSTSTSIHSQSQSSTYQQTITQGYEEAQGHTSSQTINSLDCNGQTLWRSAVMMTHFPSNQTVFVPGHSFVCVDDKYSGKQPRCPQYYCVEEESCMCCNSIAWAPSKMWSDVTFKELDEEETADWFRSKYLSNQWPGGGCDAQSYAYGS